MKYRPEIDGLRAVAVIPVILFHAGLPSFSGGFVGVDVFFVISGYLITTIILAEMKQDSFSLAVFYERRARRILPALFLVMFVSLALGWFLLLPDDMENFSKSLVAVSLFSSNILFWQESGYWDIESELKPLLHTWSLAIEEQYYFLFPIFLMIMWRHSKSWIFGTLMLIAGISLITAQWGVQNKPAATFYLLPTRIWELAIGASTAFYFLYRKESTKGTFPYRLFYEISGTLGLLMIIYSILEFDEKTPFPGFNALIPTLGAGLVILFSSHRTVVGRLLSLKPMVAVGLISYSTYLWHQPLLAFARHGTIDPLNELTCLFLVLLSIILAYFSWRYVEKPFRKRDFFSRKTIFLLALFGSISFTAIGVGGQITNGFYNRYSDEFKALMSFQETPYNLREIYRQRICFLQPDQKYSDFMEECFLSSEKGDLVVLWGDSHAAALSYGLRKNHFNLVQLTTSGCKPLIGYSSAKFPHCSDINKYVLQKLEKLKPELLILHANWLGDIKLKEVFQRTVSRIKSVTQETEIIVVGGVPQWKPSLPAVLIKQKKNLTEKAYIRSQNFQEITNADEKLKKITNQYGLTFISILNLYCRKEQCLSAVTLGEKYEPFAWDYAHLTKSSSVLISKSIKKYILNNLKKRAVDPEIAEEKTDINLETNQSIR